MPFGEGLEPVRSVAGDARGQVRERMADDRWHEAGSYAGETAYVHGRDYYRVTTLDGKPFSGSFEKLNRDRSWGEFGGLMVEIMDPGREATLEWDRWEVLRGRRMAVLRYSVDQKHSSYCLRVPVTAAQPQEWTITIAHHGFVYVDPQTGAIGRLISYGGDVPTPFPINASGDVLDYAEFSIAGNRFVLPLRAVSYQRTQRRETREEIEFSEYRKFESTSNVRFDEK